MKKICLIALYWLFPFFLPAQTDTLKKQKRMDAFSIRPLTALLTDEISLFYDHGINRKLVYSFSAGYIRKYSNDLLSLHFIGDKLVPLLVLHAGNGASFRGGVKMKLSEKDNSILQPYAGLMGTIKIRHISKTNLYTNYDYPDYNTTADVEGNSYHAGLNMNLGCLLYFDHLFFDLYAGAGFFARRDKFTYTNVIEYRSYRPVVLVGEGESTNFAGLPADRHVAFYPMLTLGVKIGFHTN